MAAMYGPQVCLPERNTFQIGDVFLEPSKSVPVSNSQRQCLSEPTSGMIAVMPFRKPPGKLVSSFTVPSAALVMRTRMDSARLPRTETRQPERPPQLPSKLHWTELHVGRSAKGCITSRAPHLQRFHLRLTCPEWWLTAAAGPA
jgi:hypothetical protein